MLSDRHRQRPLRETQRQLIVDEPDVERSFRALTAPEPNPPARHRSAYPAVIIVAALLAMIMLVTGSPGGAFTFGLIAGSVWLARYFHHLATRRPHDQ